MNNSYVAYRRFGHHRERCSDPHCHLSVPDPMLKGSNAVSVKRGRVLSLALTVFTFAYLASSLGVCVALINRWSDSRWMTGNLSAGLVLMLVYLFLDYLKALERTYVYRSGQGWARTLDRGLEAASYVAEVLGAVLLLSTLLSLIWIPSAFPLFLMAPFFCLVAWNLRCHAAPGPWFKTCNMTKHVASCVTGLHIEHFE